MLSRRTESTYDPKEKLFSSAVSINYNKGLTWYWVRLPFFCRIDFFRFIGRFFPVILFLPRRRFDFLISEWKSRKAKEIGFSRAKRRERHKQKIRNAKQTWRKKELAALKFFSIQFPDIVVNVFDVISRPGMERQDRKRHKNKQVETGERKRNWTFSDTGHVFTELSAYARLRWRADLFRRLSSDDFFLEASFCSDKKGKARKSY